MRGRASVQHQAGMVQPLWIREGGEGQETSSSGQIFVLSHWRGRTIRWAAPTAWPVSEFISEPHL